MRIILDTQLSAAKNASKLFDRSKKLKRKLEGTKKAIIKIEKELKQTSSPNKKVKKRDMTEIDRKSEWFEKFKWFITSSGFLVVGGRDAHSNDVILKLHSDKEEPVFHTEMPGSPFCVIKLDGKKSVDKESMDETAQFCGSNSRAWKMQINPVEVMQVKREQLKKTGGLKAGSWRVFGKRKLFKPVLKLAVGVTEDFLIMCGPLSAVKENCTPIVMVTPGDKTKEAVAKQIGKMIEKKMKLRFSVDVILRALPPGDCNISSF